MVRNERIMTGGRKRNSLRFGIIGDEWVWQHLTDSTGFRFCEKTTLSIFASARQF
jgi:hypothetical protein